MKKIEKALKFMREIAANNSHGYDQRHRYGSDYDCSSLVAAALREAGYNVSRYSWTGNLREQLEKEGFISLPIDAQREAGDIFLNESHHVVMCVNENTIVHASINENGKVSGGEPGDQTGKEICERGFYVPSFGWDYHFRDVSDEVSELPVIIMAEGYASSFKKDIAGLYEVNVEDLNLRNYPRTTKSKILVCVHKGLRVRNYGYFSEEGDRTWLYVKFYLGGVSYIGFMASEYLKKCE